MPSTPYCGTLEFECLCPTKFLLVVAEEGDIVELLARLARRECPDLGSHTLCETTTTALLVIQLNSAYLQVKTVCTV